MAEKTIPQLSNTPKEKLSPVFCNNIKQPGRYSDGGNLHLLVKPDGRKTWVFRFRDKVTGKRQDLGLGTFGKNYVSLIRARELAGEVRDQLSRFINPVEARTQQLQDARLAHAKKLTFKQCCEKYIKANRASWKNAKHAQQWENTLATHAAKLMPLPVAKIDTDLVVNCLEPIWATKTETATRTRQRIEKVLSWATVMKLRSGDNPAQWQGHLDKLLAKPSKLKKVEHRAALDYDDIGGFMVKLRAKDSLAARALELQILTATRPGEVCAATWDEFDLKTAVWTIPESRMKAEKEHTIPLSPQAVELLKQLPRFSSNFVFPGMNPKKPMTTNACLKLVKELRPGIVPHGFRSSFRDWAGETTGYPREVIEMAMAHQLKDKAEAAYARGNLLAKRKRLMADWANFCDAVTEDSAKVTAIRGKK